MKLESQVCSLELSQKLKELGVKQESYFYWSVALPETSESDVELDALKNIQPMLTRQEWGDKFASYSAFTVAELGEMLSTLKGLRIDTTRHTTMNGWSIAYSETERMYADTEAGARAMMLIYLLDNNLITP